MSKKVGVLFKRYCHFAKLEFWKNIASWQSCSAGALCVPSLLFLLTRCVANPCKFTVRFCPSFEPFLKNKQRVKQWCKQSSHYFFVSQKLTKQLLRTIASTLSAQEVSICGEGGIRTHGGHEPSTVFKTAAFDHSATSPNFAIYTILTLLVKVLLAVCFYFYFVTLFCYKKNINNV